jgi:fused signal recognition particle receptor
MLTVIIIVVCAAFLVVGGTGGYVAISRRRGDRALPTAPDKPGLPKPGSPKPGSPKPGSPKPGPPELTRPSATRPPAQGPSPSHPSAPRPSAPQPSAQHPSAQHPSAQHPSVPRPSAEHPSDPPAPTTKPDLALEKATPAEQAPQVLERPRFRDRLGRARSLFADQLAGVRRRGKIDRQAWEELEEALVLADVGILTTEAFEALRQELVGRLQGERELHRAEPGTTSVWLFVGVNGVGKTTTIGKVAMLEEGEGRRVVMAAGDTFRAAAADQLELWAERVGAGFVRGNEGGDPGAVVFDAVQHANARGVPLVLADTAGRLHNKVNLMEELKKVRRVADRPPGSVTEVLLVIDATTGQNGLVQAREFTGAVGVTGIVLTKLDGTAKGGIAVAIASELGIPIKLVGLGEGPEDLVAFDAREFVDALLPDD